KLSAIGANMPWLVGPPEKRVTCVLYTPDGEHVIAVIGGNLLLLDAESGGVIKGLSIKETLIDSVTCSPDGSKMAIGLSNGAVRVVEFDSGIELLRLDGHASLGGGFGVASVAYSPCGKYLATGDSQGVIRIWDAENGELLNEFGESNEAALGLAY